MLKNAKRIYDLGQGVMVLGSALYLFHLLTKEAYSLILPISIIYIVSVVMMLIGWIGTKDERKEEKARLKDEKRAQA